jgi:DNA-binding response OmpR family regulator
MTKLLLLVEDDENDVFFFQRALQKIDFSHALQVVRDGREAVAYLQGSGEYSDRLRFPEPCLVVLDLNLPHKTGLEVLQWIRTHATNPHVPVVVLTSSTSEEDLREAYQFGTSSYLNKPAHPDEFVALVRAFTAFWFGFNRFPPPCSPDAVR